MTLDANIQTLADRIGDEFKTVRSEIGTLPGSRLIASSTPANTSGTYDAVTTTGDCPFQAVAGRSYLIVANWKVQSSDDYPQVRVLLAVDGAVISDTYYAPAGLSVANHGNMTGVYTAASSGTKYAQIRMLNHWSGGGTQTVESQKLAVIDLGGNITDSAPLIGRGVVGSAGKTTDQGSITSIVDVSGLSVTWTADPSRTYRISAEAYMVSTVGTDPLQIVIANAANTQLTSASSAYTTTGGRKLNASTLMTGLSGSQTVKLRAQRISGTGSVTLQASGTYPAYIMVEDVGVPTANPDFRLSIPSTSEASLSSGAYGALGIGTLTGQHLAIDANEIQSKATGTTAGALNLNPHGGEAVVNGPSANTGLALGNSGTTSYLKAYGDGTNGTLSFQGRVGGATTTFGTLSPTALTVTGGVWASGGEAMLYGNGAGVMVLRAAKPSVHNAIYVYVDNSSGSAIHVATIASDGIAIQDDTSTAGKRLYLRTNGTSFLRWDNTTLIDGYTRDAAWLQGSGTVVLAASTYRYLFQGGSAYAPAGGSWTNLSSRTIKHDIESIDPEEALSHVMAWRPVKFKFNDGDGSTHEGFISEEMDEVTPALVVKQEQTTPSISYGQATVRLTGSMQALYYRLASALERIESLEIELADLRRS